MMDFIFDMFKEKYQKKGINDDNDVDKIVEVWKEADFLGNIEEKDITNLSLSYDSALRYVLNNDLNPYLKNVIFPLIRYIYTHSEVNKPIECKLVCKIYKKTPMSLFIKYIKSVTDEEFTPELCESIEKVCTEKNVIDNSINDIDFDIFFDLKTELWAKNIDVEAEICRMLAKFAIHQFITKVTLITRPQITEEEAIDRWTKLGFVLKSYNDNKKSSLSLSYENMAYTILTDERFNILYTDFDTSRNWFEKVVFPVIARVVSMRDALNNHESEPIDPQKIISFFENTTIGDVIETEYPIINVDCSESTINTDEKSTEKCAIDRLVTRTCFNDIFKIVDKNTPLIKFDYNIIDESITKPYNLDIEAVFCAMISELLYHKFYVEE